MTVKSSNNSWFKPSDDWFIGTVGIWIKNERNNKDNAFLYSSNWSGILIGADGYPTKDMYG